MISSKLTRYFISNLRNLDEAQTKLNEIKTQGFEKAFIIKTIDGQRVNIN